MAALSAKQDRIRRLIEEADGLADSEINAWKERARLAVTGAYGDESDPLERFDEIRWSLSMWSSSTPDSAHAEAKRGGLRRAVEMLQALAEDLDEREGGVDLPPLSRRRSASMGRRSRSPSLAGRASTPSRASGRLSS